MRTASSADCLSHTYLHFQVTTTYNSIGRTVKYISDTPPYPTLVTISMTFPTTTKDILSIFQAALAANPVQANKKRVAVIDGIISNPGIFLPWREMVKICKEQQVWSVIDGAHSIGQEPALDLTAAAPDFWTSVYSHFPSFLLQSFTYRPLQNCHKWLSAKRSCAVLYVPLR